MGSHKTHADQLDIKRMPKYTLGIGIYKIYFIDNLSKCQQKLSAISNYFFKTGSMNEIISEPGFNWFVLVCTAMYTDVQKSYMYRNVIPVSIYVRT